MKPGTFWLMVLLVIFVGLATFQLRELPGEWFGDISILHEEVVEILKNPLDWKFNLSAGPVYHHLVAMLAAAFGTRYETYKVASVLAGVAGLVLTYLMGKELFGWRTGLWGVVLMATSFWYLVWARLGSSPQIMAPVLVAGSGWLTWRWVRTGNWWELGLAEAIACLALWTYPALYTLPLVPMVVGIWLQATGYRRQASNKGGQTLKAIMGAVIVLVVSLGLFGMSVQKQPSLFQNGYIGEKVFGYGQQSTVSSGQWTAVIQKTMANLIGQMRMFVDKGDSTFRTNVAGKPHINWLTAILFAMGWGAVFLNKAQKAQEVLEVRGGEKKLRQNNEKLSKTLSKYRYEGWLLMLVFMLLLLPSSAPSILPGEIPSSGRTFGVTPYVFLVAGLGLVSIGHKLQATSYKLDHFWIAFGSILVVGVIGVMNLQQYFVTYAHQLPNYNSPYGLYVAEWLDTLPETTVVKLAGCCWGEGGQPKPEEIYALMKMRKGRQYLVDNKLYVDACSDFEPGVDYAVVFDPRDPAKIAKLADCFDLKVQAGFEDKYGQLTFVGVRGKKTQNSDLKTQN